MTNVSKNWKTLSQTPLVQNKFTELWEDRVINPEGNEMTWYVKRKGDFSIVIPLDGEFTYLVQQFRYPVNDLSWEFPMGKVSGASPEEAAITELKEETGITAKQMKKIAQWWRSPGSAADIVTLFIAEDLAFGEAEPEENEFFELKKFAIKEVGEMITSGKILDGPTIAAYHYLESYLEKDTNDNVHSSQ